MSKLEYTQVQNQIFEQSHKPFQVETRELHYDLEAGEALVKILLPTICGSEIHSIKGRCQEDTPSILGYGAVGDIVVVNSREGFKVGDRVTYTIADTYGQCPPCTELGYKKSEKVFLNIVMLPFIKAVG
ncbi:Alcohol dehydrogenase GroES-like domain-containing protein [Arenibacter nanhaiticus]|uniref:Alcohol dehydrogenase GroES-like domain-containing protein n=1 Tax=Arenibacter nanhaiticus TaxID=558155 RepID=A0A1M6C022_9FLAO|nr:alcohol dehydrogenase catalytic domain-containing protein [Arenibacter nanhaiticus]SHI54253.1 Alcohol dehydrogenase GroES-like domain-containing protein [Arenibacter nanhaiticus]